MYSDTADMYTNPSDKNQTLVMYIQTLLIGINTPW